MSDLHTLALMFRGGQRQVNLVFATETLAEEAFEKFRHINRDPVIDLAEDGTMTGRSMADAFLELSDSYGTTVLLPREGSLEAIVMQDATRAQEGGIELALLQARGQSRANTRAQHDPMIKQPGIRPAAPGGWPGRQ